MTDQTPSLEPPADVAPPGAPSPPRPRGHEARRGLSIAAGLIVVVVGGLLLWRAESSGSSDALGAGPKPVTTIHATAKPFQPTRTYVGTLEPWLLASVGPQLVSAYIDTVLVRPGSVVKRGEVLATLDCRDASAESRSVASSARAIAERQKALGSEAARFQTLLAGKFVSPNEAEKTSAASAAEAAELEAMKARLSHSTLEVNDCVLRAPFDGEVATRLMDPGAFARPGLTIVSVVDRSTVRFTADVPENDFALVPPGTAVHLSVPSTKQELVGVISRRSPAADPSTRTVHFEVDLPDPARGIPVGTTGEARLDVGQPEPATVIPLVAASVRGSKATVFVVEGGVAHARTVVVKGEIAGSLFLETQLAPGAEVVTEGRALLNDGDRVSVKTKEEP